MLDEEDDLLEGIYQGEIESTLGLKSRTDFKPWLKPRKHYIRLNQWCHETRALIRLLGSGSGGELRYLGLPGEDLLDVRVLQGVCERANVTLRYLGFDSSLRSPQLNLSRHEVNSQDFIHSSSRVIGDRIEALASHESTAHQIVDAYAPFDVINLDLCDSITASATGDRLPNLEALRSLCDIQIRRRGHPWLLFITTRTLRAGLNEVTKRKLFDRLLSNIDASADFCSILEKELDLAKASIQKELRAGSLKATQWFNAYVLSVSKWLLHYMMTHNRPISVKLLPSYGYSVRAGTRDMVSLAFLLEPIDNAGEDQTGLTFARKREVRREGELHLAQSIIKQIGKIADVDDMLNGDGTLKEKMFVKCSRLLAPLRYDMKAYKAFAFSD